MTLYVDYFFSGMPDGSIQFDEELKASSLNIQNGDKFVAIVKDERLFLKKVDVDGKPKPSGTD